MRETNMAVIPITANEAHKAKRGYAVSLVSEKAKIVSSAGERAAALGVIDDGAADADDQSGIALFGSGLIRPVQLSGSTAAVSAGDYLDVENDGTFSKDAGSGARTRAARATQSGVAGEAIGALLLDLQALS